MAVKRLSSIGFDNVEDNLQESHHVLIKEYFRRVNAFLDTVGNICPKLDSINNLYIKQFVTVI